LCQHIAHDGAIGTRLTGVSVWLVLVLWGMSMMELGLEPAAETCRSVCAAALPADAVLEAMNAYSCGAEPYRAGGQASS
jgi:predicted ABC-type sugar transport system permease subunit